MSFAHLRVRPARVFIHGIRREKDETKRELILYVVSKTVPIIVINVIIFIFIKILTRRGFGATTDDERIWFTQIWSTVVDFDLRQITSLSDWSHSKIGQLESGSLDETRNSLYEKGKKRQMKQSWQTV